MACRAMLAAAAVSLLFACAVSLDPATDTAEVHASPSKETCDAPDGCQEPARRACTPYKLPPRISSYDKLCRSYARKSMR